MMRFGKKCYNNLMAGTNPPVAKLTYESEAGPQEVILKAGDLVTLGRGEANSLIVPLARVSRNHARIEWDLDRFALRDLGSSNGTFLNGQRIQPHHPYPLSDGDEIRLESFALHFHLIPLPTVDRHLDTMTTVHGLKPGAANLARLEVAGGPEAGKAFVLDREVTTIGRLSQNAAWEIKLNDRTVSRPHLRIERRGSAYILSDLGSANGTMLNGLFVIEPVVLSDGDEIRLGETVLVFRLGLPR